MSPPPTAFGRPLKGATPSDRRSRILGVRLLFCRWLRLGGMAMLASLSLSAFASSDVPVRPLGDMLGLQVKFSQGQPLSELPSLKELGVRWVRDVIPWPDIEPRAGRYVTALPPQLKQRLDYYRDHGIGLVALLTLGNAWAYPAEEGNKARPYDAEAFGRFAATVARLLKSHGVRFVLELGNEPHNSALAKQLGGHWNGRAPSPWVDHYVGMVRAAVREVKAFDPSVRLLSSDDMWVLHYRFMEAGLPNQLDGFAVHPYANSVPERAAVAHDTDWTRPYVTVDKDGSFTSAVRRLREQGKAKLGREPSIWITEWGWPVHEDPQPSPGRPKAVAGLLGGPARSDGGPTVPPPGKTVSEDTLAAYLPRAYILAAAAGVEVLCWFSARDAGDGPMGLSDNHGRRRAGYQALRVLSQRLGAQSLVRQVAGAGRSTSGVQGYLFQGVEPGQRTLVLWNADGAATWMPLAPTDDNNEEPAIDALGRAVAIETGKAGRRGVRFGAMPIYIPGGWSDAAVAAAVNAIE